MTENPIDPSDLTPEMKQELRGEINRIVDLMVIIDSTRESIASIKKDIKEQYAIPVATITKVTGLLRKQNLDEEDEKWQMIKDFVGICE